jgi:superoxide dismutase, Cu-Zn family
MKEGFAVMKLRNGILFSAVVILLGQSAFAQRFLGAAKRQANPEGTKAVCVLQPVGKSGVSGTIVFDESAGRVHISGKISGLTPGKHAFHVHQFGDVTDEAKGLSAGGHFNPHNMPHGAPEARSRHVGDLGNITAESDGTANVDQYDTVIEFSGANNIIGHSLVVHAKPDTFEQPVGNAGDRVAVGVIGWANPKTK